MRALPKRTADTLSSLEDGLDIEGFGGSNGNMIPSATDREDAPGASPIGHFGVPACPLRTNAIRADARSRARCPPVAGSVAGDEERGDSSLPLARDF
jgi:hypothetical protein